MFFFSFRTTNVFFLIIEENNGKDSEITRKEWDPILLYFERQSRKKIYQWFLKKKI